MFAPANLRSLDWLHPTLIPSSPHDARCCSTYPFALVRVLFRPQNRHSTNRRNIGLKTTGLHRESIDLFASLDRSLSGAADKNAILRAERLVYRRKGKTAGAAGVIAGPEAAETTGGTFTGKNNTPGDSSLKKHRPLSPPPLPPRPSDKKSLSPREGRGASLAVARSGRGGADEGGTSGGGDSSPPVGSRDEGKDNAGHGQPAAATIAAAATPVAAMAVEDRPHQLKAVSSFFGNNVGRIRSAAKLAVPSSREPQQARGSDDGPVEAVTAITAASTDLAVDTTPARSPRRSFIQKVGLPRRRASCASPTARPPSELNSPPPLAPRPPRLVTATEGREPLAPSGGHKMVPLQQYVGAGDGSTAGATNLVVLDGLRLVWNLEIRDSVVSEGGGKNAEFWSSGSPHRRCLVFEMCLFAVANFTSVDVCLRAVHTAKKRTRRQPGHSMFRLRYVSAVKLTPGGVLATHGASAVYHTRP